jgi:2-iminobutanoate/2-iminopropanoate deaminase
MSKVIINSPDAPAAIGPYSQAIQSGNFVFLSGQIPLDPLTMQISGSDAASQADQVLRNIGAILRQAGLDYTDIVKSVIYLIDLADFAAVNEVYSRYIPQPFPARTTIQVAGLPRAAKIEIEVTAQLRS